MTNQLLLHHHHHQSSSSSGFLVRCDTLGRDLSPHADDCKRTPPPPSETWGAPRVRRFLQFDSLKSDSDPMWVVKRGSVTTVWVKKYKIKMPPNTIKCVHFRYKGSEHVEFRWR